MQKPSQNDWMMVKHIIRYLKQTKSAKLFYKRNPKNLEGFSDASYATDSIEKKSTSGYVFLLNNSAISWKSKKQQIVALSSMEAEYISLSSTAKEGIWLKKLETDLNINETTLEIKEDNQSTIKTAQEFIHNDRSKHIDVRYHWIRDLIEKQKLILTYCPTEDMTADIFTKSLGKVLHMKHSIGLGLVFE